MILEKFIADQRKAIDSRFASGTTRRECTAILDALEALVDTAPFLDAPDLDQGEDDDWVSQTEALRLMGCCPRTLQRAAISGRVLRRFPYGSGEAQYLRRSLWQRRVGTPRKSSKQE